MRLLQDTHAFLWFVLNDQYWDRHYASLSTHDSERVVDFLYVGDETSPPGAGVAVSQ